MNYESRITWRLETDYLRCSPSFFGRPRYDGVFYLLDGTDGGPDAKYGFGILIFVFTLEIQGEGKVPFAMIEDMLPPTQRRRMDEELGLCRVRSKGRTRTSIILAESIIRGALLYRVPDRPSDYYVVDTVDADMFIRMKPVF